MQDNGGAISDFVSQILPPFAWLYALGRSQIVPPEMWLLPNWFPLSSRSNVVSRLEWCIFQWVTYGSRIAHDKAEMRPYNSSLAKELLIVKNMTVD
jgi:hypothetical protein